MIKKRDIIQHLINNGFVKTNSNEECFESNEPRTYWVRVWCRNKSEWTHIFFNHKTHERLELYRYCIELKSMKSNTSLSCKLNTINENIIDSIIQRFLRK